MIYFALALLCLVTLGMAEYLELGKPFYGRQFAAALLYAMFALCLFAFVWPVVRQVL